MSSEKKIDRWIKKHINRDLTNKSILLTGATSGIGKELAFKLLSLKANLIIPSRNMVKGQNVVNELKSKYEDANITLLQMDLASLKAIDSFVEQIKEKDIDIDIIINNAGVLIDNKEKSVDGINLLLQTNFISTKYLTDKLIEYLNDKNHDYEIIITTSASIYISHINYDDFKIDNNKNKVFLYANTKRMLVHYYYDLLTNKKGNYKVYLTHPGATFTPLITNAYNKVIVWLAKRLMNVFFHSTSKASLSMLLALEDKMDGKYYGPKGFLGLKGFPKCKKLPRKFIKEYAKTIDFYNDVLATK